MTPSRRWPLFALFAFSMLLAAVGVWRWSHSADLDAFPEPTDAASALAALRSGNDRYVNSCRTHSTDTRHDAEHRHLLAKGQHPFAAILCCSDSRVCPEFVFDQRPGSLFEIRNAGNVVDEDVLASMEYAVEHLHVPLLVVLGHKGCGAIKAVCEAGDKPLHDHLVELQKHMSGIRKDVLAGRGWHSSEQVDRLCRENARQQAIALLRDSPVLAMCVRKGEIRLMFALYDMETGAVEFLDLERS